MPLLLSLLLLLLLLGGLAACGTPGAAGAAGAGAAGSAGEGTATREPLPPRARVQPTRLETHGRVRVDDYYWLRERDDPEVLAYLEAENAYTQAVMGHTRELQERLFVEMKGRVRQTDSSVPYREGDHYYYTRYEDGKPYPIHCRRHGSLDAPEQVMLDVNAMAEGHGFFAVGRRAVSPGGQILAYPVDTRGRRISTIEFKNLETGAILPDRIEAVTGNMAWANDDRTLFYTRQDPVTLRSHRVYRHELGSDPERDTLVYEEQDETFRCFVRKSRSKRFLMIGSAQTLASEYRYLEADDPGGSFRLFMARERGHEYSLDHHGDHFYLRTNRQAHNFRLVRTPVANPSLEHWEEVVPHREEVYLAGFEIFRDHLVVSERREGLLHLRIRPWDGGAEHELEFGEPAYRAAPSDNHEPDTHVLRYRYSSMTTPNSVYDYDMRTHERVLLKRDVILGDFDPAHYRTERLAATASDGVRVPISLVYRKDLRRAGGNPLLLFGYGSYGASMDPSFSADRLSLLDRGFVFAIAHVRGGQELGRRWYENGKLLAKRNTFTDFIACGEYLVSAGYTDPEHLFALGGSAGGLLMGAVVNMAPELFHGVIAAVPFVDVVTTMLDASIPLTTSEYDEWGDPNDPTYFEYMLSYSPYDQVQAKAYPNLLVTTGLHDSQVQYWEPAKWVAKLRAHKTDHNRLLLKTNMQAGHGGASGRYQRYRNTAFQYAFLLDLAGVEE